MIVEPVLGRALRPAAVACAAIVAAAACVPPDAWALPLFGRETGESCAACHVTSRAAQKIGVFVPGLSVGLSAPGLSMDGAPGAVAPFRRSGRPDYRGVALDGAWMPAQNLRFGAQYTVSNPPDASAEALYEGLPRRDSGSLFFYLLRSY